jgi:hypothetical protein
MFDERECGIFTEAGILGLKRAVARARTSN